MCLVEMNTSAKLVASCAMPLLNGMQIDTKGPRVKRARENVIEFLLINHPLDCPICDQAGECDLQEITRVFGSDKGRYYEYFKRAVVDKDGGTFIKMSMTRCIHCTRCVRFFNDIAGISPIGMVNRGDLSEISAFISKNLLDELSGNVIDLCPVGALTSRPYSYVARP
jgi:NADH dehydrogenase/NADH:ubiquinone oxidoreductase subunit G